MNTLTYDINQVQRKLENADVAPLVWNTHNLPNGDVFAIGVYEEDVLTGEQVTLSINPIVPAVSTLNRHVVIEVTTLTGADTLTLSGDVVNEATGVVSTDTEFISITTTGFYQSSKKFIGACVLIGDPALDIIVNVHTTSYYDAQNHDFGMTAARVSFTPSGPAWSIDFEVSKVNSDGSRTNLTPSFNFSSTDPTPRAYNGSQGHAKIVLNEALLGADGEGLVVVILNVSAISEANVILMLSGLDPNTGLPFA